MKVRSEILKTLFRAAVLLVALATSVVTSGPAQATPEQAIEGTEAASVIAAGNGAMIDEATLFNSGCGSVCDGKDPASFRLYVGPYDYYICADDADPAPGEAGFAWSGNLMVENRYSSICRTSWARAGGSYYDAPYRVESRYLNGTHRLTIQERADSWRWTAMVNDANLQARACIIHTNPKYGTQCTEWY